MLAKAFASLTLKSREAPYRRAFERNGYAPVSKLPAELLADIFILSRASLRPEDGDVYFLRAITSVTSFWRDVAIATSALWATIAYTAWDSQGALEFLVSCERLQTFLSRSREASLDIKLLSQALPRDIGARQTRSERDRRVLEIIFPHLQRFRELHLYFAAGSVCLDYFPLTGPLDRLEDITFSGSMSPEADFALFAPGAIPPLRHIRFFGQVGILLSNIPTSGLDTVCIDSWGNTLDDAISFASRCEAAREICVDIPARESVPRPPQHFSLPSLKHLRISDELSLSLIRHLEIPSIERLSIKCPHWSHDAVLPTTPPPVLPSTLHILSLVHFCDGERLTKANLLQLFQAVPSITALQIDDCSRYNAIVNALLSSTATDDGQTSDSAERIPHYPLPHLTKFQFNATWAQHPRAFGQAVVRLKATRPEIQIVLSTSVFEGYGFAGLQEDGVILLSATTPPMD